MYGSPVRTIFTLSGMGSGRIVRVLKGRNGEVGQFKIGWDFATMNFHEVTETEADKYAELEYV